MPATDTTLFLLASESLRYSHLQQLHCPLSFHTKAARSERRLLCEVTGTLYIHPLEIVFHLPETQQEILAGVRLWILGCF